MLGVIDTCDGENTIARIEINVWPIGESIVQLPQWDFDRADKTGTSLSPFPPEFYFTRERVTGRAIANRER